MATKKDVSAQVKASLAKSDKYFSKKTVDNPSPKKIVTMADIDAKKKTAKKK